MYLLAPRLHGDPIKKTTTTDVKNLTRLNMLLRNTFLPYQVFIINGNSTAAHSGTSDTQSYTGKHLKGTPSQDASWSENVGNVLIYLFSGFEGLFY